MDVLAIKKKIQIKVIFLLASLFGLEAHDHHCIQSMFSFCIATIYLKEQFYFRAEKWCVRNGFSLSPQPVANTFKAV